MRIAMVAWEYPPRVIGGLAAHVEGLSQALVAQGHEVVVLTLQHPGAPDDAVVDGVRVLRAKSDLPWMPADDFLAQMASANHFLVQLTAQLGTWRADVVHAHDWLAAWAGDTLRVLWGVPFVATIHATERGRHQGNVPPGQPQGINAAEWWLTYQAKRVICCSAFMVDEVAKAFDLPTDKIDDVPNGVNPAAFQLPAGTPPPVRGAHGPVVVTWGRIQYEKGFQTLVGAMVRLRHEVPGIRAEVLGRGSYLDELRRLAADQGVADVIDFRGFVPDDELVLSLHSASCVVIPSLYEPFGIVALEALAAGAPLVAAAAGGLNEVLRGTGAARLYAPGDAEGLADAVVAMLADPTGTARMQAMGLDLVSSKYSWSAIATQTLATYAAAGAK